MRLLRLGPLVLCLLWALAGSASAAEPAWTWPLAGEPEVTRAFDPPEVRYAAGHRGVDLAAEPGAPVLAAGAGQVSYAGLLAGRGVVVVTHGDLRTTYEPVAAEVAVGDAVVAGQRLGALGAGHEGCPAAACLHWGLRRGDTYLDPLQLVRRGPVRLLPLSARPPGGAAAGPVLARQAAPPVAGGAVVAGSRGAGSSPPSTPVVVAARDGDGVPGPAGAVVVAAAAVGAGVVVRRQR